VYLEAREDGYQLARREFGDRCSQENHQQLCAVLRSCRKGADRLRAVDQQLTHRVRVLRCRHLLQLAVGAAATIGVAARPLYAQADVIRGTIRGPDKKPVENATVMVSYYDGSLSREARTDRNGRFSIAFADGTGDYWVSVAALGFLAKRYEIKRLGDEDVLIADASLAQNATNLEAVRATASRLRPPRADTSDIGGTRHTIAADALTLDQLGDLAAMAATLPGVAYIPGIDGGPSTFSVLGLDASQNQTLLDGSLTSASNLPRDAQTSVSVATSPYDVSRGGFSGGALTIRTAGGNNFYRRTMSSQEQAPQLQWTTASATDLGLKQTSGDIGGGASGPLKFNKIFYAGAFQFGRIQNPLQTALNTSPLGLETAGIAADSVTRLLGLLQQNGIPATVGTIPTNTGTTSGSFLGRLDFTPPSPTSGQQFALTVNGGGSVMAPAGSLGATALPAFGGARDRWNGTVVGRSTDYFGCCVLSETNIGVTASRSSASPYLNLPAGFVLISSTFADGMPGTTTSLRFGGNQGLNAASTTSSGSYYNMLSWFSGGNKSRIKFTTEATEDAFWQNASSNQLGTFRYNSLADIEDGTPAAFTRTLTPQVLSGNQVHVATSLGDAWRPTSDFQLQFGVRLDANRFNSSPVFDPAVEQLFGLRNDDVPDRLYASPRVGFSWVYGNAQQVAGVVGAARAPRAVVRGGIGVFQNIGPASLISSAVNATGLPTSTQQLNCVGAAVPTPDWSAYAANSSAIPTQCADGTVGTVFANSAPGVVVIDPQYEQQRSVRGNLQWNGALMRNFFYTTVDYTQSLNLNQQESVNLNFAPTSRFTLANEDNRPVYVSPTSIVPATGAIAPGAAEVTPQFSTVTELRSDAMSDSKQFTLSVRPIQYSSAYSWNVSYVHLNVENYGNGFTNGTDGDPFDKVWARSSNDYHHQVSWGLSYSAANTVRFNINGRFQSGGAYTPLVGGDINGDGSSDDRAFVFDPAHTADAGVSSAMQALLTTGSAAARSCLTGQLGQIAGRNTCEGPWSETAGLTVTLNSLNLGLPQRAQISFSINNLPSGLDLVLHGEDHLQGWGQPAFVDPTLLYVRGFNSSTDEYIYQVNPRFGSTRSTPLSPSVLTLQVAVDVGPSRERQTLTQLLDRGRTTPGVRVSAAIIKSQYGSGGVTNPMAMLLRQSDSLKLTTNQADSIAAFSLYFTARLDSLWTPIADRLAALQDKYDQGDAYQIYRYGREQSFDLLIAIGPKITALLTRAQKRMLPANLAPLLDPKYLELIRSSTVAGSGINAIIR
jgi:hypothetical protein